MRRLCLLSLLALIAGLLGTHTAKANDLKKECPGVVTGIKFYKHSTWRWQDSFEIRHTKASKQQVASCRYGKWVAKLWRQRAWQLRDYNRTLENANRDFGRAARFAHAVFPEITETRLWYRADVEGGHGGWVERSDTHVGGWFQFMEGTYYGRSYQAFSEARRRGFPLPAKFNNWYSVLGQNVTAAYMFNIGLECSGEGWAASC